MLYAQAVLGVRIKMTFDLKLYKTWIHYAVGTKIFTAFITLIL